MIFTTKPEIHDTVPEFTTVTLHGRALYISVKTYNDIQCYRKQRIDNKVYLKLSENILADQFAVAGTQLECGGAVTGLELAVAVETPHLYTDILGVCWWFPNDDEITVLEQ